MRLPPDDTVHLFRARLDTPPVPVDRLVDTLADDEHARAARFVFVRDRRRYEVATGLLRLTLGALTGSDPADLSFDRGQWGKPSLRGGPSFNLSHSGEWWMLGVARAGQLGVDVEVHRPLGDLDALTVRTFHAAEAAGVLAAQGDERRRAFFRVWTRKEAFVKALGRGLGYALDSFVVSVDPAPARLLVELPPSAAAPVDAWQMASVEWDPELAAAVAWDRPGGRVEWQPFPAPGA